MKRLLLLVLACAAVAYPQGASSLMSGSVTDQQGALVPGADVNVTNVDLSQKFQATTSDKGEWSIPGLTPATYKVEVSKTGFKTATIENIVVNAGIPVTVNAKLEVGQTTETVVVTAGAEILQTESAT